MFKARFYRSVDGHNQEWVAPGLHHLNLGGGQELVGSDPTTRKSWPEVGKGGVGGEASPTVRTQSTTVAGG